MSENKFIYAFTDEERRVILSGLRLRQAQIDSNGNYRVAKDLIHRFEEHIERGYN